MPSSRAPPLCSVLPGKKDADRKCDPQDRVWDKDMSRGLSA